MLRQSCGPALEHWKDLTRAAKRELIQIFVRRVEVERIRIGVLHLTIYWCDGEVNAVECVTRSISGRVRRGWLAREEEQLLAAIERGATPVEIAALFPDRTWNAIDVKARALRPGSLKFGQRIIRPAETWNDYVARTGNLLVAASGTIADTKAV